MLPRHDSLSDDPSVRRHVYQSLPNRDHIRLIALHPASSADDPLRIDFLSSSLEDSEGCYEAISYTWGEPILTFALHVDDGTQVFVTKNLDRALRYLRRTDRDRILWADAASINQVDNSEKAVQIPLMVSIFRGARRVMAWVDPGGDTEREQNGMLKMDRLSRELRIPNKHSHRHRDFSNVFRFLSLPWFKRLWIVQEVVFSMEICLICGETELTFSRFIAALHYMERETNTIRLNAEDMANWNAIATIKKLWSFHSLWNDTPDDGSMTTKIIDLIERFRPYGCTDPRDRIFAVYSMATDVRQADGGSQSSEDFLSRRITYETRKDRIISMSIDYSLDVSKSYQAFAVSCFNGLDTNVQMWEALLSRQYSPRREDWPSWVPDWRVAPQKTWQLRPSLRDYPWLGVRESASGILRMEVYSKRPAKDGRFEDLYSVKLKTSIKAKDNKTPIALQLLPLYEMLRKPGSVLESDHLLHKYFSKAEDTETAGDTNFLIDMIRALKPKHSLTDFLVSLDEHLADLQHNSAPRYVSPTGSAGRLMMELAHDLGQSELFCFQDPITKVYGVGCGNMALLPGDRVLPIEGWNRSHTRDGLIMVLILRQISWSEATSGPVFRLIGSGHVLDPTSFWPLHNKIRSPTRYRKEKAKVDAWNRFAFPFRHQAEEPQYLNLA